MYIVFVSLDPSTFIFDISESFLIKRTYLIIVAVFCCLIIQIWRKVVAVLVWVEI